MLAVPGNGRAPITIRVPDVRRSVVIGLVLAAFAGGVAGIALAANSFPVSILIGVGIGAWLKSRGSK